MTAEDEMPGLGDAGDPAFGAKNYNFDFTE